MTARWQPSAFVTRRVPTGPKTTGQFNDCEDGVSIDCDSTVLARTDDLDVSLETEVEACSSTFDKEVTLSVRIITT